MNKPRVIFFGTSVFACEILKVLHEEEYNVVAVVSQPDRPSGRKHRIEPTPIHKLADEYGIPCLQPEKLREEVNLVLDYEPAFILTCAYGQIVPDEILEYPAFGCLNIHPSLLPKYRGGAPMHFPIINGDKETGVSLMEMTHKMDAGKIYAQERLVIGDDETEEELEVRLCKTSCQIIRDYLPLYLDGKLPGVAQNEEEATFCRNIDKDMELVKFHEEEIHQLYNHIRGLINWPLSYGIVDGKRIKFHKVRMSDKVNDALPGTIIGFHNHAMEVAAINGTLFVYELQMEGKKKMDADAFANGYASEYIGKRFEK